jgi:hypothetical protein
MESQGMKTNPSRRQPWEPESSVIEWLLDSDPSIRWLLDVRYPGEIPVELDEGEREPSR